MHTDDILAIYVQYTNDKETYIKAAAFPSTSVGRDMVVCPSPPHTESSHSVGFVVRVLLESALCFDCLVKLLNRRVDRVDRCVGVGSKAVPNPERTMIRVGEMPCNLHKLDDNEEN